MRRRSWQPQALEAVRSGKERGAASGSQGLQLREWHGEAPLRPLREPAAEAADPG